MKKRMQSRRMEQAMRDLTCPKLELAKEKLAELELAVARLMTLEEKSEGEEEGEEELEASPEKVMVMTDVGGEEQARGDIC